MFFQIYKILVYVASKASNIVMLFLLRTLISLLPMFVFLAALVFLDSFKLIRFRVVLLTIGAGGLAAVASFIGNNALLRLDGVDLRLYSRYGAPILEEVCKAIYAAYLIKAHRVGFMVDSAIHGFALGAGFACIENIYYLQSLSDPNILLWSIRGFGTAIMHGGTTAIFAIVAKNAADRQAATSWRVFLPALGMAIALHSFFNHFFLPPILSMLVLLLILPLLLLIIFHRSEKAARAWLEVGFDTDRELFELITGAQMSASKIGVYLQALRKSFAPEVIVDLMCYLRLHLELSIKAKGLLLMREAGLRPAPDPEIQNAFAELQYLKKSLGKIGMLAISPFLSASSRDLWQLQMLQETPAALRKT